MIDWGRHADRAIYVLIAVLAVIVALEGSGSSAKLILGSVVGAAVAMTLAELFADRVGISIREHRPPTSEESSHDLHAALTGLAAAALPTFFLLLAALNVMRLERAVDIAQWTGFAVIGIYAYIAARASGGTMLQGALSGLGLTLIGGALILLHSLLK